MLDAYALVLNAFLGKYKNFKMTRKLIWIIIAGLAVGWVGTLFNIGVSLPGYEAMMPPVALAKRIALIFDIGLSLYVFVVIAHLAGYIMENALKVPVAHRSYKGLGALLSAVTLAILIPIDRYMQAEGAYVHAVNIAGERHESKYDGTVAAENMAFLRKEIDNITTGKTYYGSYGWTDKKDNKYKLNRTGEKEVLKLRNQLAEAQLADKVSMEHHERNKNEANARRDDVEARTHGTLNRGAWAIWIILFLAALSVAYPVELAQAEIGGYAIKGQQATTEHRPIAAPAQEEEGFLSRIWNWMNPQLLPEVTASAEPPARETVSPRTIGYINETSATFKQEDTLFKQVKRGRYTPEMKEVLSHISSSNNKLKQAERRLRNSEGLPETNLGNIDKYQNEIQQARNRLAELQKTM